MMAAPKNIAWVAVVRHTPESPGDHESERQYGDWSCFVGIDRDKVVRKALDANEAWGGSYDIWVGTLHARVVAPPVKYKLENLPPEIQKKGRKKK